MKIRHLLLGLVICVAGTGAIDLSGGFLDDQNTTRLTPFLIFGHVLYVGGAPCNIPNVSITNLNTGAVWYADTPPDSNFYQIPLTLADVNVSDMLRWNATDGTVFNATNCTVSLSDLESGGIFDFDVILQSIVPGITGYAPESPVQDIGNDVIEVDINKSCLPDFTVADVSFDPPEPLLIGDPVTINAMITNSGESEGEISAEFYDTKSITIGEGSYTNLPAKWNLSLQEMGWATHGTHDITLKVDPYDRVLESNETNNERTGAIDVNPSLDFAVTEISLSPIEPVLGTVVEVSANITNYGDGDGTTVVGVFYDNRSIEIVKDIKMQIVTENENYTSTDTISLPPGVLGARLHFDYFDVHYTYIDICDDAGRVIERIGADKNNYWTDYIYTDNIQVRMELPYNRNMATHWCKFTIDGYEALIAEEPVTLNATESKVINASWRTGAAYGGARYRNITIMVDPRNTSVETNETNNTLSKQAFVNGTDLAVTAIDIPYDRCYVGQDVNVTATIVNLGAVDATNFTVIFKDGACLDCSDNPNTSGTPFTEVHIVRLDSGESRSISAIWNPAEINYRTITASIPYDDTDNNRTNNELPNCMDVAAGYDFVVESVNVGSQEVGRGESVDITATVCSIGSEGGNTSIAFFVNSTDFAGTCGERFTRIGTIDDVSAEVNETETVSMTWDVDVAGGCHLIVAVVNPDNEIEEVDGTVYIHDTIHFRGEIGNNVKNCTLYVDPPDLDITEIALVPAEPNSGDIVDISAKIENKGDVEANSTVWFYMEKAERVSGRSYSSGAMLQNLPTWKWLPTVPPEVPIRFHFKSIEMTGNSEGRKGGKVNASVTDCEGHNHAMHFYVKCNDYGGQDVKVPCIDFYTAGFSEIDGNHRRWDDVWTGWTDGTAFEINARATEVYGNGSVNSEVLLSIDKYQVLLGNETVTLRPGESVYSSTWNTSLPLRTGECYRLMANVDDRTRYTRDIYLHGTDLAVTNLSVKPVVRDGDVVRVNATIKNLGGMDATDFIVDFIEVYTPTEAEGKIVPYDHIESIDTTRIEGLCAGSSIDIPVLWNGSIRDIECEGAQLRRHYSWNEIADDYHIRVDINPLENNDREEDVANNTREKDVDVGRSRDFEIKDLSFWVNNESCDPSELVVYDDVTLNATLDITNLANQGGVVDVGFYIDDPCDTHKMGNTTVAFPAGNGTGYAEIGWNVDSFGDVDIVGSHNMTVVIDPENRIYGINEPNHITMHPITVDASDPLVKSLDVYPVNPEMNETVSIKATIANYGAVDMDNVTLTVYDWAGRYMEDVSEQIGIGRDQINITRSDAAAMRMYLDLEVKGGSRVCVNDRSGKEIVCYRENFYGWTPWVLGNNTTIVVMSNGTDVAYAEVSKIYYLVPSGTINASTHDLLVNGTKKIAVNWTPPTVGERLIAAIIDLGDYITERDGSNNILTELIQVQTTDLKVSDLSLTWLNGTEIGEHEIVKDGDDVRISANITNIGVEGTGGFDVRFLAGDLLIGSEVGGGLAPNDSICMSVNWSVTVGNHLLKVEADYNNEIDEMNETNNIAARKRYARGAELSGDTSWVTLGLHGDILFGPDQPYDGDEVNITARITNSGYLGATDFDAALFFDYTSDDKFQKRCSWSHLGGTWKNRTYQGAEYVYINVTTPVDLWGGCRNIIKDDVIIYDGNGNEVAIPVAGPEKPCWVRVDGGTANVFITAQGSRSKPVFEIYFYPIYQNGTSMLFEGVDVPGKSSRNFLIKRDVSAGDHTIMLIIDPENKVSEDEDYSKDNTISRIMHVKPTRDFMVMNVTGGGMNLSDLATIGITAGVSNIGLRNGAADVSFVDSEIEHHLYGYHFDINRSPSYLPIPPDAKLSGIRYGDESFIFNYDNLMIIHRPGVDVIELHFDVIYLSPPIFSDGRPGILSVYDENGNNVWTIASGPHSRRKNNVNIPVHGETACIYTCKASFNLDRYTTKTEFHRSEVRLNASKTWNESKSVTPILTACTGDHTITATLDENDKITEINESNNELSSMFYVNASRDPVIVGLNITPEHPKDGDNVDITAVVANNGSEDASFTVDLWANLTRNKPKPWEDESLLDPDLTTDMGGGKIRYITLLNHTTVTLAQGEDATVNATWNDISIDGSPTHQVIAIVDPTGEIDEINESNNEIVKRLIPSYPDLTIDNVYMRGGIGDTVVPIMELGGASGAFDVTVRFESFKTGECTKFVQGRRWIRHPGANNMQVYFNHLKGPVEVKESSNPRKRSTKIYGADEEFSGVWGPQVKGDAVYIICRGAGAYAKIGKYQWGNVSDEQIDYLPAGWSRFVEMPWEYECPTRVNVTVDPDNNITEINEDNNNASVLWYADLRAERIEFISPRDDVLCLKAEKFEIEGTIANRGEIAPARDFNVTLEFKKWHHSNGTIGGAVFNITEHVEELCAGEELTILFEFDPGEKFEIDGAYGNYSVFLIADSSGDICESSGLYCPWGESNNDTRYLRRAGGIHYEYVRVYSTSGYTGGGELINVAQGEVHGRVVYTVGASSDLRLDENGGTGTVRYADVIPDGVDNIEFARIFVYWAPYHKDPTNTDCYIPEIADLDVTFNDNRLEKIGYYNDTGLGCYNFGYGLYSYDVKDHIVSGENVATVRNNAGWATGVAAIGLLAVYEDEDEPLTKYWVNEGADVVMAANNRYRHGLSDEDCITTATFKDVKREDTENVNAALLTVLGFYVQYDRSDLFSAEGDALEFNGRLIGTGYWQGNYSGSDIALTENEWDDVADHLESGDNLAEIRSFGNYMMPSNAFLRLIFPPDLNVINLTAPASTVMGAHHSINVTIRNDGRSDAHDFNVTFYIDRKQMVGIPHLDLPAGENMTVHLYNWTPMMLLHSYNLTAAADVLSGADWIEVETDNNAITKHVVIEEGGFGNRTGPRGTGGGSNPAGGKFTEAITGRVLRGITELIGGGGGGAGMFSLTEWIMKGAMWLVLLLFMGLGYRVEQRSYMR